MARKHKNQKITYHGQTIHFVGNALLTAFINKHGGTNEIVKLAQEIDVDPQDIQQIYQQLGYNVVTYLAFDLVEQDYKHVKKIKKKLNKTRSRILHG